MNDTIAAKYQETANRIADLMESGTAPWVKGWNDLGRDRGMPYNAASGRGYRGGNVLTLWVAAQAAGYPTNAWVTFKQATELGGNVRKGEKATKVFYTSRIVKAEENSDGEATIKTIPFLKTFSVFNVAQCDGLQIAESSPIETEAERIARADAYVQAIGADIRHGGDRAFFSPSADYIQLPEFAQFRSPELYYAVAFHELGHWTGHESRLNRDMKCKSWGDETYAAEELVAELCAAFVCADLSIPSALQNHAAYLKLWAKSVRANPQAMFTAAARAAEAADYLNAKGGVTDSADLLEAIA